MINKKKIHIERYNLQYIHFGTDNLGPNDSPDIGTREYN